jgi:hypothetical protein
MKFKVGDRVRAIKGCSGSNILGKIGTVLKVSNCDVAVEFDEYIYGHTCGGKAKQGYGWWCKTDILEPVCDNNKIKVGEKYRVKSFEKEKGNVIEIVEIKGSNVYYRTLIGTNEHSNMFQIGSSFCDYLIPCVDNKIVITTDGKTTTAKLYDGKKLIKSANAVCSADDEFDFGIGSALAVERLIRNLKATLPDKPKFTKADLKTGMFVLLEDNCWGVVVDNSIILENGRYCEINDFNADLTSIFCTYGIIAVVKADCFNRAKEYFKNAPNKVLFKR